MSIEEKSFLFYLYIIYKKKFFSNFSLHVKEKKKKDAYAKQKKLPYLFHFLYIHSFLQFYSFIIINSHKLIKN